jgi:hypothetical protein
VAVAGIPGCCPRPSHVTPGDACVTFATSPQRHRHLTPTLTFTLPVTLSVHTCAGFQDAEDILSQLFGGRMGGGGRRGGMQSRRGSDLQAQLTVSFMDAVNGTTRKVSVYANVRAGPAATVVLLPGSERYACVALWCAGRLWLMRRHGVKGQVEAEAVQDVQRHRPGAWSAC